MHIFGLIIFTIVFILGIFFMCQDGNDFKSCGAILSSFSFIAFGIVMFDGAYHLGYDKGINNGAYNQLRGKYEISYVINADSCVTDTIINFGEK